jgi:anthranilate synthase/phosphoribosyltransferase
MILIIDNYDSFTYNLYQYLCELTDEEVQVVRNDRIDVAGIEALAPSRIVISPGPGRPEAAGVSVDTVRRFAGKVPILGVCLGHQAIGAAFGARIVGARRIVHGKTEQINLDGRGLFRNVPLPATVTRYHSLVVDPESLPEVLEITATSQDGEIMGLRHREHFVEGVQFHPESVGTPLGKRLLANFLAYKREPFPASQLLSRILSRVDLSFIEMEAFMEELTDGNLNGSQIAGFLVGLNAKGFSAREIAGAASVLRRKKTPFPTDGPVLDTCGTGGDGIGTFNISSLAAVVAAACGARVAKHGNRAVSSASGSADFFKGLGMIIDLPPEAAAELLERTDFAFLFAPLYHPAMRHAAQVRRELGMKTIMNLVGPLSNPADAGSQLVGVFAEGLCRPVAEAARLLEVDRAMVVHGLDGEDELSVTGPSRVVELKAGEITEYLFDPAHLGLEPHPVEALQVASVEDNVAVARELLGLPTAAAGGAAPGLPAPAPERFAAIRDAVALNAGAALYVYGRAESIEDGHRIASAALQSGAVANALERIVAESRSLAGAAAAPGAPQATAARRAAIPAAAAAVHP